ncbi:F-box/FBD/LRR-repeat protein At1g13570-like [Lycium ferocissimum]|uniref:F-box/FBD/LRR-repeat protein At1g13570-like n=1 Tax=Lycium ferocissimum TaxID=112874 RepID=UPI002815B407|nr:F-box/FBD/LRR-repeat protein At1g13570-like [Lycium ferocissimum]
MMPRKGRKHNQILTPDVLSNLPDNVIDVILVRLPCKDAVRTSILSKKWRYHWCRLTELTLDESHWPTEEDCRDPTIKFSKIIYQFFTLHEGPITKFTLNLVDLGSTPEIDNFIYFLSRNGIQHLVLHFAWDMECKLPSSLFMCSQLRHLDLHGCSLHPPSVFTGFDRLTSLELREVTISSEFLKSLISHCPLLQQLVLNMLNVYEMFNIIEINAPMLRSFDFSGYISSICLKNAPLLVKVSLTCYDNVEDLDFAKSFESCSALEHLLLDLSYTEIFDEEAYEAPTRLSSDFNCVKRFYLPDIMLVDSYKLSLALCWIRSFPYLEYLEIEVYNIFGGGTGESLELKRLSDMTFNHLREVKLQFGTRGMSQMQLIKLLLANSPVLVRMLINTRYLDDGTPDTRLKIFPEISNFLRASPKVEVVYKNSIS